MMQLFDLAGVSGFVVLATINAFIFVRNLIKQDHCVSMVPLIGGLSGCLGCLALPPLRYYAVAPLVLDVGTAAFLVLGLPFVLKDMWRTCRCNLLSEYVGFARRKKVYLRLFRYGIVTLKQNYDREPGEPGIVGRSTIGKWSQENGQLRLRINGEEAVNRIIAGDEQTTLHQTAGFRAYEENKDLALGEVQFQLIYTAPQTPSTDK